MYNDQKSPGTPVRTQCHCHLWSSTHTFCEGFVRLDSSHLASGLAPEPGTAKGRATPLTAVTVAATAALGSQQGLGSVVPRYHQDGQPNLPSNTAKRGKSPRNMSGCRWNMVSMGFWSPAEWGRG